MARKALIYNIPPGKNPDAKTIAAADLAYTLVAGNKIKILKTKWEGPIVGSEINQEELNKYITTIREKVASKALPVGVPEPITPHEEQIVHRFMKPVDSDGEPQEIPIEPHKAFEIDEENTQQNLPNTTQNYIQPPVAKPPKPEPIHDPRAVTAYLDEEGQLHTNKKSALTSDLDAKLGVSGLSKVSEEIKQFLDSNKTVIIEWLNEE